MVGEVDMTKEAANLQRFIHNFLDHPRVSFPHAVASLFGPVILVEHWVGGVEI